MHPFCYLQSRANTVSEFDYLFGIFKLVCLTLYLLMDDNFRNNKDPGGSLS
jgi:hypothetical protein